MVVARAGDEESQPLGVAEQLRPVSVVVVAVPDLDPAEAGGREVAERGQVHDGPPARTRVREHRDAAGVVDDPDRLLGRRRPVRLVVAALPVQDAVERGRSVGDDAERDERVCDVRPPDGRAGRRVLLDVLPGERVVATDGVHHALGPRHPLGADALALTHERRRLWVEQVAQHVHAGRPDLRGELDTGQQRDADLARRVARLSPARDGVVVGERDDAQPGRGRRAHDVGRRIRAV
ncbi:hypothetical protein [Agrococcus sp. Marseille-P2731]|uniref:hypothetical protein n=1 Tax=Agrococcus sp. Marseille-P2731 TaxID=1841862 RepID=UPI001F41709E|nr:hypothetical protein [Agrococcus sp. Marseille-P2731]